jgi:chaperonin GroEL
MNMTSKIVKNDAARSTFLRGVERTAQLVSGSIGPYGGPVFSSRNHTAPALVRGGYAIAKEAECSNLDMRSGTMAMRQLAAETHAKTGDGTARTIIMTHALLQAMTTALATGISPAALQKAILSHGDIIARQLENSAAPIANPSEFENVALHAASGARDIALLVFDAQMRVGNNGFVQIRKGYGATDEIIVEKGFALPCGLPSPQFAKDIDRQPAEFEKPLVLLYNGVISSFQDIARILEMIAENRKSLLIAADGFGTDAMATLLANRHEIGLNVAPLKTPGAGSWRELHLQDLAVATGATILGETLGTSLQSLRPAMLGMAEHAAMTRDRTTLTLGKMNEIRLRQHLDGIRLDMEKSRNLSFDHEQHQERLARFLSSTARVHIGGVTTTEMSEREARALSVAASLRQTSGGVIAGGAAAFIHAGREARRHLPAGDLGQTLDAIFTRTLRAPLAAIVNNAGMNASEICYKIEKSSEKQSFNAITRTYSPNDGSLEPVSVLTNSLRAAVSFGANFIATEILIHK